MSKDRFGEQLDLFANQSDPLERDDHWLDPHNLAATLDEPPPEDFIERIRDELLATLVKVRAAATLPWDLTQSMVAEMRFRSIAGWLPREEARRLRTEFVAEMERLYDAADEHYPYAGLTPR